MYAYDAPTLAPYIPTSWKQLLRQIEHLAQFGGAVQVISGAEGSGKTTFLGELTRQPPNTQNLVLWPVIEEAWPGQALQNLLTALGIDVQSGQSIGQSIVALRHFAQNLQRQKKRVVVAVDDSDLLTDACLAGVASVLQGASEEGIGLHVIFFTQRSLAARLDRLQLIDVTVYDFELPSFTLQEVGELLAVHFDEIVQREAIRPLTRDDMHDIWQSSQGMPGIAVTIAKEKWALGLLGKRRFLLGGFPLVHIAASVLLVAALVWAIWGREKPAIDSQTANGIVTNLTPQIPAPASNAGAAPIEMKKIESPVPAPVTEPASTSEAATPETANPVTAARPESPAAALAAQIAETQALKQQQAAARAETTKPEVEKPAPSKPDVVKTEPAKIEPTKPEPTKPAAKVTAKTPASEPPPMMPAPIKAAPTQTAADKSADGLSWVAGSKKLASLPETQFVLQLMYSTSAKKIETALAAAPNKKDLLVYHTLRDGKDVYILVEGNYADSKAATAGIKNLPADQKAGQPWPKKVGLVHAEIKAGSAKN